ncbi:phosphodiesterase [Glaciimonas immobilis]|uniref:3',5'-cyclic AMP phosphodiesterase CpdA n=1 Tax=Glaciimonas immobilis TaxID=728004 RepID=A0A840RTR8_9BURK|nr:phosphodiesterase [Glaciimonas immobilis]KAF3996587.1 phosphodiesterase [Glaciimonas immobilis]MBB5201043.1 3',5'-cyclic AMP phosphodiesterase CpdA [Glaciimonas immobilis]
MILCQISDLHIKAHGKKSYRIVDTAESLRRCVAQVNALRPRPDAMVITGDLVDFGLAEEYVFLRHLLQSLEMPFYLIPGNHDDRSNLRDAFPEHTYLQQSKERIEYVIDDYPLRIVALDTVIPQSSCGALAADSLVWLDQVLAAQLHKPTVIIMHHPPFHTGIGHMDKIGLAEPQVLAAVVQRHPQVERILCGHLHRAIQVRFGGSIASTCPGVAHQVALDLSPQAESCFVMEPPAFQLHVLDADAGLISHTAYIGEFDGPYPFYDGDSLID